MTSHPRDLRRSLLPFLWPLASALVLWTVRSQWLRGPARAAAKAFIALDLTAPASNQTGIVPQTLVVDRPGLGLATPGSASLLSGLIDALAPALTRAAITHALAAAIITVAVRARWTWRFGNEVPRPTLLDSVRIAASNTLLVSLWPLVPFLAWAFWQEAFLAGLTHGPGEDDRAPALLGMFSYRPIWVGVVPLFALFAFTFVGAAALQFRSTTGALERCRALTLARAQRCEACGHPRAPAVARCVECGLAFDASPHVPTTRWPRWALASTLALAIAGLLSPWWMGAWLRVYAAGTGASPLHALDTSADFALRWFADVRPDPAPLR